MYRPKFVTARLEGQPEQCFQLIWPYTDVLLHDVATAWPTTAPLWGIGLTEQVDGHTQFLRNGRARSLLEAILWHGGEAEQARDRVVEMPEADRDALLRCVGSLAC